MSTPALFSPVKVGNNELKHRIVLPPLTRMRANDNAVPNDLMKEYYSQRTTDGGLLITEATFISRHAGSFPNVPGIYSKEQISGWKKITDEVHSKGAVIFLQIVHAGRVAPSFLNEGQQPVSASAISVKGDNIFGHPQETPQALTIPEIEKITQDFRQAALNAMEAGFDGVEIHSANGFLIDQFLNTSSNVRTDIYGGSAENRCRFPLQVASAIVDAIGAERTAVRFSPWSTYQDMKDENPYETWGYLTSSFQANHPNLAYLHFLEPRIVADGRTIETTDSLDPFRKAWKGPFVSSGGYGTDRELAFKAAEKTGDLISFGRHFLANPDLVERLRNGWPFNKYDRNTFYGGNATGYTDYSFYKEE